MKEARDEMFGQFLQTCKDALSGLDVGSVPSHQLEKKLEPLLASIRYDVNGDCIDLEEIFASDAEDVAYLSLLDEASLKVGIFIIPAGGYIPFHDHPGMCVVSRVLCGELTISSIDWNGSSRHHHQNRTGGYGQVTDVKILRAPEAHVLYPDRCNIHELRAGENQVCAVLDVITPDYDVNRPCTYYDILTSFCGGDAEEGLAPGQPVVLRPKDSCY